MCLDMKIKEKYVEKFYCAFRNSIKRTKNISIKHKCKFISYINK